MAGVKIYELARKVGMPSKELAAWAKEAGFSVKTHMSAVDEETAEKILTGLEKAGRPATRETDGSKTAEAKKEKPKAAAAVKEPKTPSGAETKATPRRTPKEKPKAPPAKDEDRREAIDELEALEKQLETQEKTKAPKAPQAKVTPVREAAGKPPGKAPAKREGAAPEAPAVSEAKPEVAKPQPRAEEKAVTPPSEEKEPAEAQGALVPAAGRRLRLPEAQTVKELAELFETTTADLLMKLMGMGILSNVNALVDDHVAAELARQYGFEPEAIEEGEEEEVLEEEREEDLLPRPPVVTVMGHVDHGKTSLLDAIRKTNVTQTEAGSITQHIGAYQVTVEHGTIVFLDTPGHEAFTAMRARGAKVTDIVVLVVAANDGVMPQTREAIAHARAADVPLVVAVNKIDLPNANPEKVRRELSEFGLIPEAWGGETIFVDISAKQRVNIDALLEMILLQAEIMELKANPNRRARCVVIEAELDKGRGPVARVLVQQGTLRQGDPFVVGSYSGRARALINDAGRKVGSAGPSMPVEVLGLSGVPQAGDVLTVMEDERKARQVATQRMQRQRQQERAKSARVTLEDLYRSVQEGAIKELAIVLKADTQGSIGALQDALEKLSGSEVRVRVIHSSAGGITETDVMLASASNAIIVGFHVRPTPQASTVAQREEVDIRLYNIIYDAIKEVRSAMSGLLEPTKREVTLGRAEVREVFHIPKVGSVAGCYVLDGVVQRNALARVIRDNIVIYEGKIGSLRRFKEDVAEVGNGYECGIGIENFQDVKQGDIIEPYILEMVERTL
ncbi:MAG: translation initiation factor IF-2 [Candidatus Tectomicrobia bacterium]|nr:translation initiation factor IF-2 [Candidatus Tectomicrobia bacterium]